MKKLLFIFALMCGAMFTSCNNATKTVEPIKVDTVTVDSTTVDTLALDSVQF